MSEKKGSTQRTQSVSRSRTSKILVKQEVSSDVIVEKLSELSEQVKDVKRNVESIEALSINSDKTLAVQAQQLAEHI